MPNAWDRHLDEEQAERYSMGTLSEEEEARCEEHLLVCERCRRHVRSADRYVAGMKSATQTAESAPGRVLRPRWFPVHPAWALAAALLIAGGIFLLSRRPGGPPVAVQLTAVRGIPGAAAPGGADLKLFADVTGLPAGDGWRLELVDSNGRVLWAGAFAADGVTVPRQPEGVYYVRLRGAGGELRREYGLVVTKTRGASNVPR